MKLFNKKKTKPKEDERLHKTRSLVIYNKKRGMVVGQTCGNYVPSVGDYIEFWHSYCNCTCIGKVAEVCFNRLPMEDPNMIDVIVKKVKRGGWKRNRLNAK